MKAIQRQRHKQDNNKEFMNYFNVLARELRREILFYSSGCTTLELCNVNPETKTFTGIKEFRTLCEIDDIWKKLFAGEYTTDINVAEQYKSHDLSWFQHFTNITKEYNKINIHDLNAQLAFFTQNTLDKKIKNLIDGGADIKRQEVSALLTAVIYDNLPLLKYLVSRGADIYFVRTAILDIAMEEGYFNIIRWLIEELQIPFYEFMLRRPILYNRLEVVKYLVEKGVPIICYYLIWTAETGNVDIMKYLVSKGGNIHDNDRDIMKAAGHSNIEMVKYLISIGGDIHYKDGYGYDIILYSAIKAKILELVKYLIEEAGADPHFNNDELLNEAISWNNFEMIKYLIEKHGLIPNNISPAKADAVGLSIEVIRYLAGKVPKILK